MPLALVAVLGIVLSLGLCWALLVPPWQSPDENAHFAYAQSLAERGKLPGGSQQGWSTDQELADAAVGAQELAFESSVIRPNWNAKDVATYRAEFAHMHPSRSNGGGENPAGSNPPLYYAFADLAYFASYSGDVFDRLYSMRIWGISLLLAAALGAWLLAGEVFGRRRLLQLVCAAVVGLFPMETFMATSVNPDGMLVALWTFALWLGARVILHGARTRDLMSLSAVTAAAVLTKGTSYGLIPAVVFAMLVGLVRCPRAKRLDRGLPMSIAGLVLVIPIYAWIRFAQASGRPAFNSVASAAPSSTQVPTPFKWNQFLAYVWQYYLPRLPFMGLNRTTPGYSVYNVWVRGAWGTFGWLEFGLPTWAFTVLASVTAAVGFLSTAIVATLRGKAVWALIGFFALAFFALLFGLHLTDYRSIIRDQGALLQGRYLLPVLALFGLAVALIVSRVPLRWRGFLAGAVLTGLLVVQVMGLAAVAGRYYA